MYNKEIKDRFLREGTGVEDLENSLYLTVFKSLQPFEAFMNRDISQMSAEELSSILEKSSNASERTLRHTINDINKYRKWCADNKIFVDCNREPINANNDDARIVKIRDSYFLNATDMVSKLRQISPAEEAYPEAAAFCFIWCGLTTEESCNLLKSQVDLKNGIIYQENGSIWVSNIEPPILEELRIYANTYRAQRSTYEVTKSDTRYFLQKMLRAGEICKNGPIPASTIQSAMTLANAAYKKRTGKPEGITVNAVSKSGSISRLRKLELDGVDIYKKSNARLVQRCFNTSSVSAKDSLKLYEQFKKAFNID